MLFSITEPFLEKAEVKASSTFNCSSCSGSAFLTASRFSLVIAPFSSPSRAVFFSSRLTSGIRGSSGRGIRLSFKARNAWYLEHLSEYALKLASYAAFSSRTDRSSFSAASQEAWKLAMFPFIWDTFDSNWMMTGVQSWVHLIPLIWGHKPSFNAATVLFKLLHADCNSQILFLQLSACCISSNSRLSRYSFLAGSGFTAWIALYCSCKDFSLARVFSLFVFLVWKSLTARIFSS